MLASTVQFSNNDQPPITPGNNIPSALGPASRRASNARTLRHPTACPTRPADQISVPHTPKSAVLAPGPSWTVPSSQRSTHEQPVRDVRPHAGLWTAETA
jgi:hypothetical protein